MRFIKNFLKYRELLNQLVVRDIKVKYRRSVLGILWSLLNPLLMMVVITIVFSNLFRFDIKNFPVYLLTGQILFNFFSESTSTAMTSIIGGSSLIKKVYIPKYIFPISRCLSSFVNLIFALPAILVIMAATKVKFGWTIILFPLPLIFLLIFAMGISLIISAYAVFFRDIVHLYSVFLTAWMYLTPIFYPVNIIPDEYKFLIKINPMYYIIEIFRDITLYARMPSGQFVMIGLLISITTFIIGAAVFYKNQNRFILYI